MVSLLASRVPNSEAHCCLAVDLHILRLKRGIDRGLLLLAKFVLAVLEGD